MAAQFEENFVQCTGGFFFQHVRNFLISLLPQTGPFCTIRFLSELRIILTDQRMTFGLYRKLISFIAAIMRLDQ